MQTLQLSAENRKQYISDVGQELVQQYGKQKYYTAEQVRKASRKRGYSSDYEPWADCLFLMPDAFDAIYHLSGPVLNYAAMRSEILADFSGPGGFEWPDIDLSWLEWPDIDLSGLFDWFNW